MSSICFQKHSNLSPADISIWVSLWSTILLPDIIKDDISKDLSNVSNWLINIEKQPVIQVQTVINTTLYNYYSINKDLIYY